MLRPCWRPGAVQQDKVAHYLYNCPAYLESMFAMFKAALVPVNTNYRYTDDELAYLWDNSDAVAVVFHGTFTERCAAMLDRVPAVRTWIWVDDGTDPCPDWAIDYEVAAAAATARTLPPWGRSPDDLYMLFTGGTTGLPKGVMWRQDDLVGSLDAPSRHPLPVAPGWDEFDARIAKPGPRNLPAAPLMHGTGAFNAMWNLVLAGSVVTNDRASFRPGRTARQHSTAPRQQHVDRRRRVRQAGPAGARRASPTDGTSRRCASSCRAASSGRPRPRPACCVTTSD